MMKFIAAVLVSIISASVAEGAEVKQKFPYRALYNFASEGSVIPLPLLQLEVRESWKPWR